jgi:hypothetical protein
VLGGSKQRWMVHCMTLPTVLDHPRPRQPFPVNCGTIDLARGAEAFPVSANLGFTHNGRVYIAEPPEGLTRWVPLHPRHWRECTTTRDSPGVLEIKGTPLMLSGLATRPELNGVVVTADRLVVQALSEQVRVRVLLDDGAAISVKASCCNVRAPLFQYDTGPVPLRFRLQVFKVSAKSTSYQWAPGYGVRALEDIPPRTLVCVFWGKYNAEVSATGNSPT